MKNKISDLHLHHVSIRNDAESCWKKQDEAMKPILDYFTEQQFKFEYSDSIFEFMGWNQVGYDSDLLLLIAQKLAQNFDDKVQVIMGWNPTDMRRSCIEDRARRGVTQNIWLSLIESARNRQDIDKTLHFPLIEAGITKTEMMKEMPQDLLSLTWSCRRSKDGKPCGRCHACRDIANA